MGKTRPHTIEEGRKARAERLAKADALHSRHSNAWFREYNLLNLEEVVKYGIWSCYDGVEDFLIDFWMDFSWSAEGAVQMEMLINDPRFNEVDEFFKSEYEFDLRLTIKKAIKLAQEAYDD
jgi:hypothetical protein